MMRSSFVKKITGLSPNDQYGVEHASDANVVAGANAVTEQRGAFPSNSEWRQNFVDFKVAMNSVKASVDKALSAAGAAQYIAASYAQVTTQIVNLVANTVNGVGNAVKSMDTSTPKKADPMADYNKFMGISNSIPPPFSDTHQRTQTKAAGR
jgi:hypothetical protein